MAGELKDLDVVLQYSAMEETWSRLVSRLSAPRTSFVALPLPDYLSCINNFKPKEWATDQRSNSEHCPTNFFNIFWILFTQVGRSHEPDHGLRPAGRGRREKRLLLRQRRRPHRGGQQGREPAWGRRRRLRGRHWRGRLLVEEEMIRFECFVERCCSRKGVTNVR